MGYAVQIDLDPWQWGYVVVQKAHDGVDFCDLLRGIGATEEIVSLLWSHYLGAAGWGGYCHVVSTHAPWIIVVFASERASILKTFVHEVVHLGEHLPFVHSISTGFPTQEIRARIAARAFELFYPTVPSDPI